MIGMMAYHHSSNNMKQQRGTNSSVGSVLYLFGVCLLMPKTGFLTHADG